MPAVRASLCDALRSGRVQAPMTAVQLEPIVGRFAAAEVTSELMRFAGLGMSRVAMAEALALLDVEGSPLRASLVWTGPEGMAAETQDTGVAMRQLFQHADTRVLVAGFAVYQGRSVFQALAERMQARPGLSVDMYLNVERKFGDTTLASDLLRRFVERFKKTEWSGAVMPRVFYDPRSLKILDRGEKRAVLHAKCIVVDGRHLLVTSANFTEAAQERNIEMGVVIDAPALARSAESQFDWLVEHGHLQRVPGL